MQETATVYHGYSIEDAIDGISAAGFHFIELTATKGWTEHVFPDMSFKYLNEIKSRLKKAGLIPISMSGHCNLMDKERIGDFLANIQLANFFGCNYIVSSIGEAHLKDNTVTPNEQVAEHIKGLFPALEENNLTLVLENHGDHSTGKIIKSIVDLVNSPRVLINYDTANVLFYADVDPLVDIPTCIDKIGYFHLKDKLGGYREWNFPALGEGHVDFPRIFALLDKSGNTSPMSIEIEFTKDGPQNLAEVNRAMKTSYDYLIELGLEI